MGPRFSQKREAHEFFPNSCVLSRKEKVELFEKIEAPLLEILKKMPVAKKHALFRSIPLAKSRGIDFVTKHICIECTHPNCRHKAVCVEKEKKPVEIRITDWDMIPAKSGRRQRKARKEDE